MAIDLARRFRPLIAVVAVVAATIITPALASAAPHAAPAAPAPSVTTVQKQLGELALQNSQLVEQYDQAQLLVAKRDTEAKAAQATADQANQAYREARSKFTQMVQAQYEGSSFGAAGALLDNNSNVSYLDRLDTLNMVTTHTAQVVAQVTDSRTAAVSSATQAHDALASATAQRDSVLRQRQHIQDQIDKYQKLLATLNSAQQYAYLRASNPSVSASTLTSFSITGAPSAGARKAVQYALAQVGKPYVFGAAGPSSFDCSGLTMASWQQAGVSLPHSAAGQYGYGTHVSRNQLLPGDLIFFYQPIGHVTIYIGNGMMVSAPTSGQNVSVVPLSAFNSDYTGATRVG